MKRFSTFALLFLAIFSIFAQQKPEADPTVTEIWEPIPPKVTPGQGSQPPSDAIVLFDGTDTRAWEGENGGKPGWSLADGAITVVKGAGGIRTKQAFADCQLHVEWRSPNPPVGEGQGRGNSGIFLMNVYEVQVLDSYVSRTYSNGQASSVYKQHIPLVNACLPAGEWQTYDIIFSAPRFGESGRLLAPATVTVLHNGILVQNHVSLLGPTAYRGLPFETPGESKMPILLQDHGDPVSYRNIWIRPL